MVAVADGAARVVFLPRRARAAGLARPLLLQVADGDVLLHLLVVVVDDATDTHTHTLRRSRHTGLASHSVAVLGLQGHGEERAATQRLCGVAVHSRAASLAHGTATD